MQIPGQQWRVGLAGAMLMMALLGAAPKAATPPSSQKSKNTMTAADAPAVVESLSRRWRVEADGRATHLDAARVKIREESALQAWSHLFVSYIADRETVELRSLIVEKPDGQKVTVDPGALKDMSPTESGTFDAPTFTDARVKQIAVPSLGVGDTVSYEILTTGTLPFVRDQFWTDYTFSRTAIVTEESFVVDWPAAMTLGVKVRPDVVEDTTVVAEPGRKTRRWTHSQPSVGEAEQKAVNAMLERGAQGKGDSPDIQLSTFASWNDVARWYAKLTSAAEKPSAALHDGAIAAVRDLSDPTEKLKALHKLVSQDIRYTSLAFGNGHYQPRPADLVLSTGYGDCKDKHGLLAALGREVGVDVRPVLINSRRSIDDDLPSPGQFDHVVSVVSDAAGGLLWMDGTADVTRPGTLYPVLRDKPGLLVGADGTGRIVRTPAEPSEAQFARVQLSGTFAEDGHYVHRCRREVSGDAEMVFRKVFKEADQQARFQLAEALAKSEGLRDEELKVNRVDFLDPRDLQTPFWFEYEVETSFTSPLRPKPWTFWMPTPDLELPAAAAEATEPIELGMTGKLDLDAKVEFPATVSARAPLPVAVRGPFAAYQSTYEAGHGVLHLHRHVDVTMSKVQAADLPAYRSFKSAVDADRNQQFAIDAAATAAPASESMTADQLYDAGKQAEDQRDYERAVTLMQQATAKAPKHAMAWNELGRELANLGRNSEAIEAYDKQIAVAPYHEYAYNNRGLAQWQLGKLDDAERSFLKQIEVVPLDKWAHANLGLLQLDQHRNAEAVSSLERAVAITPKDVRALVGLGRAYLAVSRPADAVATFDRAAESARAPGTLNDIAWWLAEADVELDRSLQFAQQAVGSTVAYMNVKSLADVKRAQLGPVIAVGSFWDTLGWVYFKKRDYDRAVAYLQAAEDVGQGSIISEHLGRAFEASGHKAQAIDAYTRALGALDKATDIPPSRLRELTGRAPDISSLKIAGAESLVARRTFKLPRLVQGAATAECLVLVDGTGAVIDARFLTGDSALKSAVARVIGTSTSFRVPEGSTVTVIRRGALTCNAQTGCAMVLYPPQSVRSIE